MEAHDFQKALSKDVIKTRRLNWYFTKTDLIYESFSRKEELKTGKIIKWLK
jgi:hypothetical protein